jgi:hypothetical protein
MATLTRTNPAAIARGTINATRELVMYKAVLTTPSGDDAVIGSDAVGQKIGDAIGSFSGLFQIKSDGAEVYMVVDRHATDLTAAAIAIGQVLETGDINSADFHPSTDGAGVCTLVDNSVVTVTEVTDIEAI